MPKISRDAKQIVDKFASAIASASCGNPAAMNEAAAYIRSHRFRAPSADTAENSAVEAFASYVEARAAAAARVYMETYSK